VSVYFLKTKSDTTLATKKFLADSAPYGRVKCKRSDNGTEYTSDISQSLLREKGIKHETSSPYSPHQNGTDVSY
jgi:transposase InsO family protein